MDGESASIRPHEGGKCSFVTLKMFHEHLRGASEKQPEKLETVLTGSLPEPPKTPSALGLTRMKTTRVRELGRLHAFKSLSQ